MTRRIELSPSVLLTRADLSYRDRDAGEAVMAQVSIGVGECVTDLLEIEGRCYLDVVDIKPASGYGLVSYAFGGSGGLTVNIETTGRIVPYFHIGMGAEVSDDTATEILPIVEAGLRAGIGEGAAMRVGLLYQHIEDAFGIKGATADIMLVKVGLSAYLQRE
jgi:hypothetical protein